MIYSSLFMVVSLLAAAKPTVVVSSHLTLRGNRCAETMSVPITGVAPVLRYEGQDGLSLDTDGNLIIRIDGRDMVQELPAVFQRDANSLRLVSAAYVIGAEGNVTVRLGPYDHTRPLETAPVSVCPARP